MEKIDVMVPPPLTRSIEQFREEEGYENRSQAIRELLRRGLSTSEISEEVEA